LCKKWRECTDSVLQQVWVDLKKTQATVITYTNQKRIKLDLTAAALKYIIAIAG